MNVHLSPELRNTLTAPCNDRPRLSFYDFIPVSVIMNDMLTMRDFAKISLISRSFNQAVEYFFGSERKPLDLRILTTLLDGPNVISLKLNHYWLDNQDLRQIFKACHNIKTIDFSHCISLPGINLAEPKPTSSLPQAVVSCGAETLDLTASRIRSLNLSCFTALKSLTITGCKKLTSIENFPTNLVIFDFTAHQQLMVENITLHTNGRFSLKLRHLKKL